jgi:hypothetical protein
MEFTRNYPLVLLEKAGLRQGRSFECEEDCLVETKSKFCLINNKYSPSISETTNCFHLEKRIWET